MLHKIIRVFLGSERLKFKQAGWHLAACTALWLQITTFTISDIHITISEITDLSFAFFLRAQYGHWPLPALKIKMEGVSVQEDDYPA